MTPTTHRPALDVQQVPQLDLKRQFARIRHEIEPAIARVCESQHFVLGTEVEVFEQEAAKYLGVAHVIGCASGTDALWMALAASGAAESIEVATTPFSFFASASSILRCGARPVFFDIQPQTFNLDPEGVERRLKEYRGSRIRAMMPVHLYGQCADMDRFNELAQQYKLAVVEDAAQAFGSAWRGKRAGGLGTAAGFSFYPTKNLSCYGDGGCVTTNDAKIAARVRSLRNHGSPKRYVHEEIGWNSRLDAIQGAVLRVKLKHIETWNEERRAAAARYDKLFKEAGLLSRGSKRGPVQIPATTKSAHHIYHQYVVRAERRDALRTALAERQVGTEIYYPIPLHLQKCLRYLGYTAGDFPEAERAAAEVLALPIFPELTEAEQQYVVQAIADFYS
jgi:dTDP-4-amino-4,6-dideoxygalactose transaminase